jgi:hypothetical protein
VTGDSQRGGAEDAIRNEIRTGEALEDAFHVGEAAVGVTGQRLLVRQAGRTRAADLTNVRTVHLRTVQERHRLTSAGLWGGVALLSAVAWLYAPLEGLVAPVEAPPGGGFEGLYHAVGALVSVLVYVDEAFLFVAALALAWAGWQVVAYIRTRREVLEVIVGGADPIHLPAPADDTAVDRLRGTVSARLHDSDDRYPD